MALSKFVGNVFKTMFTKHLLVTNTIVSGSLMGLGDYAQQSLERWTGNRAKNDHDWKRTGRMTTVGLIAGPFVHGWYKFLDSALKGTSKSIIVKKVLADQLVAAPSLLAGFFLGMGMLEGKSLALCVNELKEKFLFVFMIDCTFWPPLQVINFCFLPPHLRVLYVSSMVFFWDTFLSYAKHKDLNKESIQELLAQFSKRTTTPSAK